MSHNRRGKKQAGKKCGVVRLVRFTGCFGVFNLLILNVFHVFMNSNVIDIEYLVYFVEMGSSIRGS